MQIKKHFTGKFNTPNKVAEVFYSVLQLESETDQDKEHFWVMGLSSAMYLRFIELISLGTLNASLVHPREVFRPPLTKPVSSIVIAHNHPSGITEPSSEDKVITTKLEEAGKLLDVPVLDHVIIGNLDSDKHFNYFSFKEEGLI